MNDQTQVSSIKKNSVFVSYTHKDKEQVHRISNLLRTKFGIEPWLDEVSILPGEQINKAIEHGIKNADLLFLMLSPNALASNWVDFEWRTKFQEEIIDNRVAVICVLIEEILPEHLPAYLQGKKYIAYNSSPTKIAKAMYEATLAHSQKREDEGNRLIVNHTANIAQGVMRNDPKLSALGLILERATNSKIYQTQNMLIRFEVLELDIHANLKSAQANYQDAKERFDESNNDETSHPVAHMLSAMAAIKLQRDVNELGKLVVRVNGYKRLVSDNPELGQQLWEDIIECINTGMSEYPEYPLGLAG